MSKIKIFICLTLIITAIFGCSPAGKAEFDKDNAFDLLKKQTALGPRYPGSPAHDKMIDFIKSNLKGKADGVKVDSFQQLADDKYITLSNIIAYFNPNAERFILLAAHWDTRPTADMEITEADKNKPILGANDGASGVAVLLELARMFAVKKPDVGIVMVFFDGEDYTPNMFLGSIHLGENLEALTSISNKTIFIDYGILLDMVGDKNLNIYKEANSVKYANPIVNKVWDEAKSLGYSNVFIPQTKYTIADDHIPLNNAGLKCIDIIDFDYGPWHTLQDTVDKCSPDSLKVVGDVVAGVIYKEKAAKTQQ